MKKITSKLIIVLILAVFLIAVLSNFIINIQWFGEVGYLNVFFTSLKAKVTIFVPSFIILFFVLYNYGKYLKNNYPYEDQGVYDKAKITKSNKIVMIISTVAALLVSLFFTNSFWYRILEFYNATDFNVKDPVFNLDIGFYVFKLPLIEMVLGILMTIVVILVLITLFFYTGAKFKEGRISIRGIANIQDSPQARFAAKQLSIFGAVLLLLFSGNFYLKALNLVYSPRGVAFGASYTDVHVTLPMLKIISVLCIVAAFVVGFAIIKKRVKLIVITAVLIFAMIISEGLISEAVERFIVKPNARDKEMPYLTYNIEATRKAFGLDTLVEKNFPVDNTLNQKDIDQNKGTIENIRVNEFSQALEVYNQIQAIRNYYKFNDMDIDRYEVNGRLRQVFLAARELDISNMEQKFQTWQNKHLFYTHGYGAAMSYTNTVNQSGLPEYILKDIPVSSVDGIKIDRPQVYFGEVNDEYIVVQAKSNEIDYPTGGQNKENRYEGKAGIRLTPLNRILFAVNKGSMNFLLSQDITSQSRVVLNRNIVGRVNKIAPFIRLDSDPYIVTSGGKLYWIIDGYTITNRYPFSEQYGGINYIRNSIKVVVDAYDGTVDFYLADQNDAIAKTIGKIYKGIFKDINEMPSELRKHLKYSEDVFLTQATVYEKYHMSNPMVFYNNEDLWSVAKYRNTKGEDISVEPVYQVMKLPDEDKEEFLLTIPFVVAKKENMVSWLAVRMDGDKLSQMIDIKFPKDKAIYGPQQFNSKINTDTTISGQKTLWGQQGSEVIMGETNIIPIKNSLIYVKPFYLKSQGGKSLPELKKVIVGFGDRIVMEDNIEKAFERLFNVSVEKPETGQVETPGTEVQEDLKALAAKAAETFNKAKEAQTKGDWAAYGQYLKELEDILSKLNQNVK